MKVRFFCIEAPCCYQDPKPYLVYDPDTMAMTCPYCQRLYTSKSFEACYGCQLQHPTPKPPTEAPMPDKREYHLVMDEDTKLLVVAAISAKKHDFVKEYHATNVKAFSDYADALQRALNQLVIQR